MSIDKLRKEIDKIDEQLVDLLNERAGVVVKVGKLKNKGDKPVYVPNREKEVFKLLALGAKNEEIAEKLSISAHTVKTHRSNIMKKLGVHNLGELVRIAIHKGLISSEL